MLPLWGALRNYSAENISLSYYSCYGWHMCMGQHQCELPVEWKFNTLSPFDLIMQNPICKVMQLLRTDWVLWIHADHYPKVIVTSFFFYTNNCTEQPGYSFSGVPRRCTGHLLYSVSLKEDSSYGGTHEGSISSSALCVHTLQISSTFVNGFAWEQQKPMAPVWLGVQWERRVPHCCSWAQHWFEIGLR